MTGIISLIRFSRPAVALTFALMALSLSGCSMIGLGIGSAIDGHSRHTSREKWSDLGEGKKIKVYCTNGTIVTGKFESAEYESTPEYNRRFDLWRAGDSTLTALPTPGSAVTLDLVSGEQLTGEIVGYQRIAGQSPAQIPTARSAGSRGIDWNTDAIVVVRRSSNSAIARFNVNLLKSLRTDSLPTVSTEQLYTLIVVRKAPELSSITVSTEIQRVTISLDEIRKIDYDRSGNAKWIGLGVGLAIDAGMVALAIALNDMTFGYGSGGGW